MNFMRMYVVPFLLRFIFSIRIISKQNLRRASQIAIKYPKSSLSKEGESTGFNTKAPGTGDRAPYCLVDINGEEKGIFNLFNYSSFTILLAVKEEKYELWESFRKLKLMPLSLKIFIIANSPMAGSFFKTYGVKKEAVFVVRPDGHIGFRSSKLDVEEVKHYLKEILYLF
ncbi:hypothetical protein BH23BAC1_BH23BAC1_36800 [soil metagenome]